MHLLRESAVRERAVHRGQALSPQYVQGKREKLRAVAVLQEPARPVSGAAVVELASKAEEL